MTRLTDLSNELLHEIMRLASYDDYKHTCLKALALMNKQLRTIAFPMLVNHWTNFGGGSDIGLLALHLSRYPQHRLQLRSLDIENYHGSLSSCNPELLVSLRLESCEELAKEAERSLPDLTESSETWVNRIRKGFVDAIVVLILAWATRLTELRLHFRGFRTFRQKILLGRCVSRLSQLSVAEIDVGHFLPIPTSPECIAPDCLVSQLPGSLKYLIINWHRRDYMDVMVNGRAEKQVRSCIIKAICELLQEAGPGRKFNKLYCLDALDIRWSFEELNRFDEIGKSRGVIVVKDDSFWNGPLDIL